VLLRNHTLMTPEAIQWLNRFAHLPLNDHQRLALVYLKQNHHIDNQDYRRLNRVDMITAGQDLRGLVQADLVEQTGVGRWTKYGLKVLEGESGNFPLGEKEKKIIAYIRQSGSITNAECRELLGTNLDVTSYHLKKMTEKGLIKRMGKRRWTRYELP
jgi:predicted HTH transcriptional regulator